MQAMRFAISAGYPSPEFSTTGQRIFEPELPLPLASLPITCLLELEKGSCGSEVRSELLKDPGTDWEPETAKFLDRLRAFDEFDTLPDEV